MIKRFLGGLGPSLCRAPDDGGGSGAAAAAGDGGAAAPGNLADAAAAAAAAGGAAPPASGQASGATGGDPSQSYRPEGLPDHLLGKSERETLDNVFKAYDGSRREIAERGTVPKDAKGYVFTPADDIKDFIGDLTQDGLFTGALEDAHAEKMTDKQTNGFLNRLMKRLVDLGAVEKPVDFNAEISALVPLEAKGLDDAGQKAAASRRIRDNLAWIEGAKAQGQIDGDVADYLQVQLADSALGHRAIEFIRKQADQAGPALGGEGGGGGATEADYDRLLNDDRQRSNDPKVKEAWATEKQALAKRLWGTAPRA